MTPTRNAFFNFLRAYRETLEMEDCSEECINSDEVVVKAARMWKGMSLCAKRKFIEEACYANYVYRPKHPRAARIMHHLRNALTKHKDVDIKELADAAEELQAWKWEVLDTIEVPNRAVRAKGEDCMDIDDDDDDDNACKEKPVNCSFKKEAKPAKCLKKDVKRLRRPTRGRLCRTVVVCEPCEEKSKGIFRRIADSVKQFISFGLAKAKTQGTIKCERQPSPPCDPHCEAEYEPKCEPKCGPAVSESEQKLGFFVAFPQVECCKQNTDSKEQLRCPSHDNPCGTCGSRNSRGSCMSRGFDPVASVFKKEPMEKASKESTNVTKSERESRQPRTSSGSTLVNSKSCRSTKRQRSTCASGCPEDENPTEANPSLLNSKCSPATESSKLSASNALLPCSSGKILSHRSNALKYSTKNQGENASAPISNNTLYSTKHQSQSGTVAPPLIGKPSKCASSNPYRASRSGSLSSDRSHVDIDGWLTIVRRTNEERGFQLNVDRKTSHSSVCSPRSSFDMLSGTECTSRNSVVSRQT